jgi:chromosome segregation protein
VTTPARLQALRLQGFKSFAERTLVEFGAGISAVVGPNGSGKSNLADALRWALGEQGRSLRIRRSEDVIFAGSERRSALGMADVTLVIDNADGLLPVEYAAVELGRRLYRSGENDYLLNRQRIRLRDLVELLDAANLADNAFLFIGQGMVDQALALRPEERRPLFEEVAGVRRHERRRRRAEEQLAEAETNLARVEDIVGELRPQARRLATQAEQQATRADAGDELAEAVVLLGHARWHQAAARLQAATRDREDATRQADGALRALTAAEDAVAAISAELAARALAEAERRERHEADRAAATELQLRETRLASDLAATRRDRERAEAERRAAEAGVTQARRSLAVPVPPRDHEAEADLVEAERALADALTELGALRAARQARGEQLAALRRVEAARQAEVESARRRAAETARRSVEEAAALSGATAIRIERDREAATARASLAAAVEAEASAGLTREAARIQAESVEVEGRAARELASSAAATLATVEGQRTALEGRLADEEARSIARAARRHGGRRLDEELQVDPALRAAVEAALGEAARAFVVAAEAVPGLAPERGSLVVAERIGEGGPSAGGRDAAIVEAAGRLGGGSLMAAVRRDPDGAATRLLERVVWLPDLEAALELQPRLPPGWSAVVQDGSAIIAPITVRLGSGEGVLDRRVELERAAARAEQLATEVERLRTEADEAERRAADGRTALDMARAAERTAMAARRQAEEAERVAARALEAAVREVAWHEAQSARLAADAARAAEALERLEVESRTGGSSPDGPPSTDPDDAIAAWERRAAEARVRRDGLAEVLAERETARRGAEAVRTRAEAEAALGEERAARASGELEALALQERDLAAELETIAAELARAMTQERASRALVEELVAAAGVDRARLEAAEAEVTACRDRSRRADERLRGADVAELESRLALDAVREGLLVELAGLGETGLRRLAREADAAAVADGGAPGAAAVIAPGASQRVADGGREPAVDDGSTEATDDEAAALEAALSGAGVRWALVAPVAEVPSAARLGVLRRRFHELGAVNPYAVEEYAAVRERLETLEDQERDLRAAIETTRRLIEELDGLIADQFRSTFRALESAFDRRFQQLFGGGFARLSLTEPGDLAATGVEIVARPPGKRAQPLAMLSGGERALTAVALLFAMLEVRPVPFCVLDEVDAALDEANVGRFTDALRELASRTQCIVITHNRGTIESADALYGVTVGDDSVSRVISLRLEEAQEIADRARGSDGMPAAQEVS